MSLNSKLEGALEGFRVCCQKFAQTLLSELVTSELGRTSGAQGELLPLHRLTKPDQNLPVFLILQWEAKERGRGQGQCSRKEDRSRRSPAVLSPSAAELGRPGEPRLTAAGAPAGALAPAVPAKAQPQEPGRRDSTQIQPIRHLPCFASEPPVLRDCPTTGAAAAPPRQRGAGQGRAGCDSQGLAESIGSDPRRESAGWPWERGTKKLWRPSVLRKGE